MDNGTGTNNGSFYDMEDPFLVWPIKHVLIVTYTIAFFLGLAGNLLVLFVIIRNKSMQTVTNFFLANLAVADLLVVICCIIPKLLYYITPTWPLGAVMCKLHNYMISATSTASIFILTVISVERFIAILFPLRTRQLLTAPHLIVVISFVWISSAAFNVPQVLMNTTKTFQSNVYCTASDLSPLFTNVYTIVCFVLFYTLPLVVMTILYGMISCKLWINTDKLHAGTENETKPAEADGRRFWHKIPPKVRYFVNSRGNKCNKDSDELGGMTRSANKKDAECADEVEILMETTSPRDGIPANGNERVGPFLLDEPAPDTYKAPSPPVQYRVAKGTLNNKAECIPMTATKSSVAKKDDDKVNNNRNNKHTTQDSLPTSQQRTRVAPSSTTNVEKKRRKKKSKREEVLAARKKVIRLLVVIVISFALCLFPVQLLAMWTVFGHYPMHLLSAQLSLPFSFWLYFLNSALNPFLYAFLSDNFRRKMKETLLPRSATRRQQWVRTQTQTRSMTSEVQTETETMY